MSEFDWCRTGPLDLQGLGSVLFGERSPRPFLFCGSLLHKHKHFPRVDVAWLPCPPAASFIGSITLVRCLPLASCSLVNERYCVILSMEHCEGSCCCETSLLLQVRFEISRYGLLRFNIILSFDRFEAAVENACRTFYSSTASLHYTHLQQTPEQYHQSLLPGHIQFISAPPKIMPPYAQHHTSP